MAAEQREAAAAQKKEEKERAASARGTLTLAAKALATTDKVVQKLKAALAAADGVVQSSAGRGLRASGGSRGRPNC